MYRIARGTAPVPLVAIKLMDMYERHGIPEEHKQWSNSCSTSTTSVPVWATSP